jgi:hypothetical protein
VGEAHPYLCTARISPFGPKLGLLIDDPDQLDWRGDFVGDQLSAWCDADPFSDVEWVAGEVLVVILTGARHDQYAHAQVDGGASGTAWLRGMEPFLDGQSKRSGCS